MIATVLLIISSTIAVYKNKSCVEDPFNYIVEELSNEDSGNLMCRCSFSNVEYSPFIFSQDGVTIVP